MTTDTLDPLIHAPARLRIVVTLATLPGGDTLSLSRLQDMIGLTPGNLISQLRQLEDAGYVQREKTRGGSAPATVALTHRGRGALDRYAALLPPGYLAGWAAAPPYAAADHPARRQTAPGPASAPRTAPAASVLSSREYEDLGPKVACT
jgi:DNA-binding MarR family transcriptional regulator